MVESPCIAVCRIDLSKEVCAGCYRTLEEIARWRNMTDIERKAVLASVESRRIALVEEMPKTA